MFYDLNVPWTPNTAELQRTLEFLAELDYNTIALNHFTSGRLPGTGPIPSAILPLPFTPPPRLKLLTRVTLLLTDPPPNSRLAQLSQSYDILALRPISEKTLQQACSNLECDLVSLDLSVRYPFHFRHKQFSAALARGVKFEICYAPCTIPTTTSGGRDGGGDVSLDKTVLTQGGLVPAADAATARRNLISNATGLIRALRGKGVVVSSEARRALGVRGPWDVVNLCSVWGLGQEKGREAVGREARAVVVQAGMRRRGWRGVVEVVEGGNAREDGDGENKGEKRKAAEMRGGDGGEEKVSKNELKRRKKAMAKAEAARGKDKDKGGGGTKGVEQAATVNGDSSAQPADTQSKPAG